MYKKYTTHLPYLWDVAQPKKKKKNFWKARFVIFSLPSFVLSIK